ncbi:rRNA maturation RNase YbeY [Alicyclobacillus sp. SO9]|uniref:rRNA maturation RNase YbeY n=1 Tax=Alicyclobacillus sp. SO9 TaxID=2665646 RepID=UPI0018E87C4D|nr:rRNA maturation RNase YbeY [Alicyclobacillus sp. SO9]QQE77333.1 rRNA maturation RNase YbeY [Alicyclobacillus sp. SO9]
MSEGTLTADLDVRYPLPADTGFDSVFVEQVLSAAAESVQQFGEVSVSLVSDEEIHTLNRDYRDVNRPTDVLSFSMLEGNDVDVGIPAAQMLGDIVISWPAALRQAEEYGHSVKRELAFLLVHGFLHLVGYDHQTVEDETEMFAIQEQVLTDLGLTRSADAGRTAEQRTSD